MFSRLLFAFFLLVSLPAFAATLYVDTGLSADCSDYDPSSRACGNGADRALRTLDAGLASVAPGDELVLRAGQYGQIDVQKSGTTGAAITIRAQEGELVGISSSSVGINVIGRSDVTIKNINVSGVQGFGRIENSTRIVFDGISFSNASASGTTGALKFVRSTRNKVLNSNFKEGSDLLILQDNANENLLQGNAFGTAAHSLISIRCSSRNVLRDNEFRNPDQKAMEIYDCEGISDAPVRYDDTRRNLFEANRFLGTKGSGQSHDYNAIQHGGQQTIARFNVFMDNLGGGSFYQYYPDESLYVHGNRLYNNTFYRNRCYAISGRRGTASRYYDNRVVNNLLFANTNCSGGGDQVSIENTSAVILTGNSIVDVDPGFVSATNGDLHLAANSSQIDAGDFVATATGAGSGTSLQVDDASWFFDGFGIPGEQGDVIRIAGQSDRATILAIDYANNTLALDRPLVWSAGAGVHVAFEGDAPDVGAFEYGGSTRRVPKPPTGLSAE